MTPVLSNEVLAMIPPRVRTRLLLGPLALLSLGVVSLTADGDEDDYPLGGAYRYGW
jgi:hypothetical protein